MLNSLFNNLFSHYVLGGFANDVHQSFFLHITPHSEHVERGPYETHYNTLRHEGNTYLNSVAYGKVDANGRGGGGVANTVRNVKNTTRIMIPLRDEKVWDIVGTLVILIC